MMAGGFFDYWGKASPRGEGARYHLLAYHCLDVAAVAAGLLDRDRRLLPKLERLSGFSATSLRRVVPYLLALHDLGKFADSFQDYRPGVVAQLQGPRVPRGSGGARHDVLGYRLWRSWASRGATPEEVAAQSPVQVVNPAGVFPASEAAEFLRSWFGASLGHHGTPPDDAPMPASTFQRGSRSRADALAFVLAAREVLRPGALECTTDAAERAEDGARRSSWWVAGFAILCDWIGSGEHFRYRADRLPLEEYQESIRETAEAAVAASGVVASSPKSFGRIGGLFPSIATSLSPLQEAALHVDLGEGPRLFVMEDLTGSGKTEAGLLLAQRLLCAGRADGIFFALPTMATANAMEERVRPLLCSLFEDGAQFVLAHSGPRLDATDRIALGLTPEARYAPDEEPPASSSAASWIADNRKKTFLADLGVGTIDQALLAVLQSKHAALRLFGLQRRVLVVDEVHACDAYMREILCKLLEAHGALGGSAILLSATLPAAQRAELVKAFARGLGAPVRGWSPGSAYPLLTASGGGQPTETKVEPRADIPRKVGVRWLATPEEAIESVVGSARQGRCVCWIRNSVADALEAQDALVAALGPDRVTLFHARFALEDRLRIETDVVQRFGPGRGDEERRGRVVVATQVVEQSLDIDFDAMVTDLCPVDLVIQRAGRLQRHRERPRPCAPVLEVVAPEWNEDPPASWLAGSFRRTATVYPDPGILWRTVRVLRANGALDLPVDARTLVEAVYGSDETPEGLRRRSEAAIGVALSHGSVAQTNTIRFGLGYVRSGHDWSEEMHTPTRLGEPTTTVRLARVAGDRVVPWAEDVRAPLRWQLSQVSVARRLVAGSHPDDAVTVAELEESQPFKGDDVCTIVLRDAGEGFWTGKAIAERRQGDRRTDVSVRVRYSRLRGLAIGEGA